MLYAVFFEDNDDKADQRQAHMPDHLAFLNDNKGAILAAGPLMGAEDPENGKGAGGLWLVEGQTAEEVRALVETDPFWPTGLRKSVRILLWRQVFAGGQKLI